MILRINHQNSNIMKKVILFIVASIMLLACESVDVTNGRKMYKDYFNYVLKDPSSLQIHNEQYHMEGEFTVIWTVDYSAKNSLGGMVRETIKFKTCGSTIIVDSKNGHNIYDARDLR